MKGFFSSTAILLAVCIIALAASVALLEQSHSKAHTSELRNQIAFEKNQDATEIASAALTHVIAASAKQVQCTNQDLNEQLQLHSVIINNSIENENLSSELLNLQINTEGIGPYTISGTFDIVTNFDNSKVEKNFEIVKKLEINPDNNNFVLNVTDLNSGNYKQFTITCLNAP